MTGERVPVRLLTKTLIPNVSRSVAEALGVRTDWRSLGLLSADSDDVTYLALDEATKTSNVEVVYAKSLYAGAGNATTRTAGEVIGILAGPTPSEVESGLERAAAFLREGAAFQQADDRGGVVYLAHCVARSGSFLSRLAHVPVGQPLAYLIAPPVEAVAGLDAAIKASDVELAAFFAPPSETNFGGGLLTGTESACRAACDAFARCVVAMAGNPME